MQDEFVRTYKSNFYHPLNKQMKEDIENFDRQLTTTRCKLYQTQPTEEKNNVDINAGDGAEHSTARD